MNTPNHPPLGHHGTANHRHLHRSLHEANPEKELNPRQQEIIEAALELLGEKGIQELSLRDIAKRMGIKAPALYWHFSSKEVLIDYIAEAILQKELSGLRVREDSEPWQDWLTNHLTHLRAAMLAYPDGGRIVAGAHLYPAVTLAKSFECSLQSLRSAGLDLETARHIILTATHYTFGHVIEEQAMPSAQQFSAALEHDFFGSYPNLQAIMERKKLSAADRDDDFAVGLGYIIKGSIISSDEPNN